MRIALPASLSAGSFPFTPACAGQYTHRSFGRWMPTFDTLYSGLPIPLFTFCSKLIESVKMMTFVVRLSPLEAIQRRAWLTASTSVVKLEVETVCAASYVLGDFVFGVCVCGWGGGLRSWEVDVRSY